MADNVVTLVGNTTRDSELRFLPNGSAVVEFGLAVNNRKKDASGNYVDDPKFFDVKAWGSLAENVAESITRGMRVVVTGRLDFRSWETPEGDKRSKVEVIADEVGPSLRWATATVAKTERRGPGSGAAPTPVYEQDTEPF